MEFYFPYHLRPSKVTERRNFYSDEFDLEKTKRWIKRNGNYLALAFDIGSETTRYRPRFKKYLNKIVYIRKFKNLEELRDKIIRYSPEDLYFSIKEHQDGTKLNNYRLAFELDPRNFECNTCDRRKRKLEDDVIVFCEDCAEEAAEETLKLYGLLDKHFEKVKIIFTGIGYYLVVEDDEALNLGQAKRKMLNRKVRKEFRISSEITKGEEDLLRLPGSLNGLVSRKSIELEPSDLKDVSRIYQERSKPNFIE